MFDAARRDLERKTIQLVQGIGQPCGENAAKPCHPLKRKIASRGQRVLNGLSGAGAWNWAEKEPVSEWFANTESLENCLWFNAALIP
jgi:hypothetical protein